MKQTIKTIGTIIIITFFMLGLITEASATEKPRINTKGVKKLKDININTYHKDQYTKKMFIKTKYATKKTIC